MLHHIIVKWIPGADRAVLREKAAETFADTCKIPGITACELLPSCSDRANRADLMIRIRMAPEALPAWDASEIHQNWKRVFGPLIASKTIFDCEEGEKKPC